MATKKQNRRFSKRKVRRALNKALDFFTKASGRKLNHSGWGGGIAKTALRDSSRESE